MAELTPRARNTLVGLGCVYAFVNTFIGIHSGGDLVHELALTERLLHGLPLYDAVDTSSGLPWPPFATVALIPVALLARVSLPVAKALWAIGNVVIFGWCLVQGYRSAGAWTPVIAAVAAIAQPLQSNFQHLNINLVLLGLVVLAIGDLSQGRGVRAAVWVAVATALKGYPGAIFVSFVRRDRWPALVVGGVVVIALTSIASVAADVAHPFTVLAGYVRLATHAPSTHALARQPIGAAVVGLGGGVAAVIILNLCVLAVVAATLWRRGASPDAGRELGMSAVLAVLLAPLDHLHFYVLAFPGWCRTFAGLTGARGRPLLLFAVTLGAFLTSGMLVFVRPPLPGALAFVRDHTYALGALLLVILMALERAPLAQPSVTSRT